MEKTQLAPVKARILLDREQLAWAAGFFDGEGSTTLHYTEYRGTRVGLRQYASAQISVAQIDPEVLVRFQMVVGAGVVYGPYRTKGRRSPHYQYHLHGIGARTVLRKIWPWLSSKKKCQARTVFRKQAALYGRPRLKTGPMPKEATT